MKITLAVIGKTGTAFVRQGIEHYVKRLQHYVQFDIQCISDVKGTRSMTQAKIAMTTMVGISKNKSDKPNSGFSSKYHKTGMMLEMRIYSAIQMPTWRRRPR